MEHISTRSLTAICFTIGVVAYLIEIISQTQILTNKGWVLFIGAILGNLYLDRNNQEVTIGKGSIMELTFKEETNNQGKTLIRTFDGNKYIGQLTYSEHKNIPCLEHIEVPEAERRRGRATAMLQNLQDKYKGQEIEWAELNEDAEILKVAVTEEVIDESIAADFNELERLTNELENLENNLSSNPDEITQSTDQWRDLEDRRFMLEKNLDGKSSTKILIINKDVHTHKKSLANGTKTKQASNNIEASKRLTTIKNVKAPARHNHHEPNPGIEYQRQAKNYITDKTNDFTPAIDLAIAAKMLSNSYDKYRVQKSIEQYSPVAVGRDKSYARGIVAEASKQPEVKQALRQQTPGMEVPSPR